MPEPGETLKEIMGSFSITSSVKAAKVEYQPPPTAPATPFRSAPIQLSLTPEVCCSVLTDGSSG